MERNLPNKKAFAMWYIKKELFLRDKDAVFLSVSDKNLNEIKELFS